MKFPQVIRLYIGVILIYIGGSWGIYSEFVMGIQGVYSYFDLVLFAIGLFFILRFTKIEVEAKEKKE